MEPTCQSNNHPHNICRGDLIKCADCKLLVCEEEGTSDHSELCDTCYQKLNLDCLICEERITDEEFQFEDYYTVYRGHNAKEYKGADNSETGFICFDCIKESNSI